MAKWARRVKFKKRQLLLGAALFSAGILTAIIAMDTYERMQQVKAVSPLSPGSGESRAQLDISWLPDTVKRWEPQIEKYSQEYEIDPNLLAIMMTVESGGDPNADSGFAKGLMQVTDSTAGDINNRLIGDAKKKQKFDLKDPETSIEFGAVYVRYLVNQYGDPGHGPSWNETVTLVAAGYNGGPTASNLYVAEKWKGLERYDRQTINYARYVRTMWQERNDPLSFAYRHWYETGNGKALVADAEKYKKNS